MAGKYTPLEQYLKNSVKNDLTLSFADIERIIVASLPMSAHEHGDWWANEATENKRKVMNEGRGLRRAIK